MKNILWFSLGLVTGSLAGALITRKIMYDKCQQVINDELTHYIKEEQKHQHEGIDTEAMKCMIKKYNPDARETAEEIKEYERALDRVAENIIKYNPNARETAEELHQHNYSIPGVDLSSIHVTVPQYKDPYVISTNDYYEDQNDPRDKVTLEYYLNDDILCENDSMEIVPDRESIIGRDALQNFGNLSGDPHVVYVRNERLNIDYEVILINEFYAHR
jgi:hypothetical protein